MGTDSLKVHSIEVLPKYLNDIRGGILSDFGKLIGLEVRASKPGIGGRLRRFILGIDSALAEESWTDLEKKISEYKTRYLIGVFDLYEQDPNYYWVYYKKGELRDIATIQPENEKRNDYEIIECDSLINRLLGGGILSIRIAQGEHIHYLLYHVPKRMTILYDLTKELGGT